MTDPILQRLRHPLALAGLAVVLCATLASARNDHERARELSDAGKILPLEQVLAEVLREYSGELLEVELEREDGIYIYEVEMVDDRGVVWGIKVNAHTGQFIEREREQD